MRGTKRVDVERGGAMSDVLATERIGQLTGGTRTSDPLGLTTDWTYWPLLNQTSLWGVNGVDLGANTEHNERLYIFFGDVAIDGNPDPVCWTTDTVVQRHGGHLALGWDFRLPNDHQGATQTTGQWEWRLCEKCHGIFFSPGQQSVGVCPAGGSHAPLGWNFVLPNDHQGAVDATGQRGWRPCDRCAGLFYAPNGDASRTVCPAGGPHSVLPEAGSSFFRPRKPALGTLLVSRSGASAPTAIRCTGTAIRSTACARPRLGRIRLNCVLDQPKRFAAFSVDPPIGILGTNETPTGAFSHAGRAYVFIWVGKRTRELGTGARRGSHLTSKEDPRAPVATGSSNSSARSTPTRLASIRWPQSKSRTLLNSRACSRIRRGRASSCLVTATTCGLVMTASTWPGARSRQHPG